MRLGLVRVERGVTMIQKRTFVGAIALILIATMVAAGAISASDGDDDHGPGKGATIVGTWDVTVSRGPVLPPVKSFQTFNRGGTIVETANDTLFRSPSHGAWEYVGERTYATTTVFHRFSPTGAYLGTQKIDANRQLSHDGEMYTAVAVSRMFDPDGNLTFSGRATATAKRLKVERIPDQP
jgi:hypothetical protein